MQANCLRDEIEAFELAKIKVFGVSADNVAAQKKFHTNQSLNFPLIADPEKKVIKAFGVKMLGDNFAARQSFLIKDGRVVWRDLGVNPKTHAAKVLEAAKKAAEK